MNKKITELFIKQEFSDKFYLENSDKLDFNYLNTTNRIIPIFDKYFELFPDKVDWEKISAIKNLSQSFIRKYHEYLIFDIMKHCQANLCDGLIGEYFIENK